MGGGGSIRVLLPKSFAFLIHSHTGCSDAENDNHNLCVNNNNYEGTVTKLLCKPCQYTQNPFCWFSLTDCTRPHSVIYTCVGETAEGWQDAEPSSQD